MFMEKCSILKALNPKQLLFFLQYSRTMLLPVQIISLLLAQLVSIFCHVEIVILKNPLLKSTE